MAAFEKLTRLLSGMLRAPLLLFLGVVLAVLIAGVYIFAYLGTVGGILIAVAGIVHLEPAAIVGGLVLAAIGSFFYQEYFVDCVDPAPTLTELIERIK